MPAPAKKKPSATRHKKKTLTNEAVIAALYECHGIVNLAAQALECNRSALSRKINGSPELKEAQKAGLARLVDVAETALMQRIRQGDTTAIIFALKTQGRQRGWEEKPKVVVHQNNVTVERPAEKIERWRSEL